MNLYSWFYLLSTSLPIPWSHSLQCSHVCGSFGQCNFWEVIFRNVA